MSDNISDNVNLERNNNGKWEFAYWGRIVILTDAEMTALVRVWHEVNGPPDTETLRLIQENAALLDVIQSVEWVRIRPDLDICPSCRAKVRMRLGADGFPVDAICDPHVHREDCRIDAALRPALEMP